MSLTIPNHAVLDNGNMVPDNQFKQSGIKNRLPLEHVFILELKLMQNMLRFAMVHPLNETITVTKINGKKKYSCPKEI